MNLIVTLYSALLFFVLVPGILVSFPPKKSKFVVAGFHAIVFALVWHFTNKLVWRMSLEGMEAQGTEAKQAPASKQEQGTEAPASHKVGDKCSGTTAPKGFSCKNGKLAKE